MSQPHLSHKIAWDQLSDCCRIPDESSIYLPVGNCGLIHITKKSIEIQIKNRKYLQDINICTEPNCEVTRFKRFDKKPLKDPVISVNRPKHWCEEIKKKFDYFYDTFFNTIVEFAETEEKKLVDVNITEDQIKGFLENLPDRYYWAENDGIVLSLFLSHDLSTLLSLNSKGRINIYDALRRNYGGQAVGNGYRFLMFHLFHFYLTANMIIRLNLQNEPSKWGFLNPEGYSYKEMLYDCDFLTFIPHLRYILTESLLFKDLEKTSMLLKEIFRYIYTYVYLCKTVGYKDHEYLYDDLKRDVSCTFQLYFND